MHRAHAFRILSIVRLLCAWSLAACAPEGAAHARAVIHDTHAPEVRRILAEDIARHLLGSKAAAARLVPGFAVDNPEQREAQVRTALRLLTKPPRGIAELIASARSFTAAVGADGVVIATDASEDKDRMTGLDVGKLFPVVQAAAQGKTSHGVHQFPAMVPGTEGSWSLLLAAPSIKAGIPVGSVLTGIPLWKLSQRLTRQMQLDHASEKGAIFWVYMYKGDKLHHFGTPPDLDTVIPDASAREAGLAKSPGGFTGEFMQFGRWYAFGVVPLRNLGPDLGAIIVRADPV
ncbi:MAG: hypothetical protein RL385_3040 [Pseudomonadota bacterium]|jgi:hypothetical protein